MFSKSAAFSLIARTTRSRAISSTALAAAATKDQAEVVLVGCGAPNRGMGWYHAVQMLEKKYVVVF
jgi:hypothetical protein